MPFQIIHLPKIRVLHLSRGLLIAAIACVALSPGAVLAATATTTFQVNATVAATCVLSATNLAFGTYSGVQSDITSSVTATCTNTTPYTIGLSAGAATGASVTTRAMTGPAGALLNYSMFRDSSRSLNWGSTVATDTVGGTGNGQGQSLTVYGRIDAGQYVAPGAYTDTITATITF